MTSLKKISILTIAFAFILSLSYSTSLAQVKEMEQPETYTLKGEVVNAQTGDPLPKVEVTIVGTDLSKETGEKGKFTFKKLPEGTHVIKVKEEGYKTWKKEVTLDENSKLEIKVKPAKK